MPRTPATPSPTTFFVFLLDETRQTLTGIATCLPGDGEQLKNSLYAFVVVIFPRIEAPLKHLCGTYAGDDAFFFSSNDFSADA